jgi:hypothetical protein
MKQLNNEGFINLNNLETESDESEDITDFEGDNPGP